MPERLWLIEQLTRLQGPRSQMHAYGTSVPHPMSQPELAGAVAYLNSELDANWHKINTVSLRLLQKLPRCEECSEYATAQIRNGPFLCGSHAAEHPTAQTVEWAQEISELGVGSSTKS
jgi:hypothetical protein